MLDLGWGELLIIGVVALIVVGPRDFPRMFRALGRYTGRMRGMARDLQRAMNQAADESGIRDVAKDIEASASARDLGLDAFDNVAKRVGSTLGKGPTGIAATGAAATAANMIMNPGKPAGTESVMQEGDHEKLEGRKGVRAADSSQSTTMKPDHDQKHAGPRNDPMSSGAEPPDVTATSANERAS